MRDQVVINLDAAVGPFLVEYLLEALVAELVPVLKLAIVLRELLHCVVRKVHVLVVDVLQVDAELARRSSKVALLEDVKVVILVDKHPHADVELAIEYQQRPLNVFLDDERVVLDFKCRCLLFGLLGAGIFRRLFLLLGLGLGVGLPGYLDLLVLALAVLLDELVEGVEVAEDVDTSTTVQVSWLEKPEIKAIEVAKGKAVLSRRPLLKVESFELSYFSSSANCARLIV